MIEIVTNPLNNPEMSNNLQKYNVLKYIQFPFSEENEVNDARIFYVNKNKPLSNKIFYLVTREFRLEDNFAYNFARQKGKDITLIFLTPKFELEDKNKFFEHQFSFLKKNLEKHKINHEIFNDDNELFEFFEKEKIGILIKDFNPIEELKLPKNKFPIIEVDGHNICPARYISNKQEYNAASLRHKIYNNIAEFLTEFPKIEHLETEAEENLKIFIQERLDDYAEFKNNPAYKVISDLSKYINWGFISSQRIAVEIIKSDSSTQNKESFLEELIIRKELSDNFCLYNAKFKTFDGIPNWAKETLDKHKEDIRTNIFSLNQLENAKSYDKLWNASQNQLLREGKIHGYMRMYWAKKILEWTNSPQEALDFAIYLNDKYAFDAPSSNGYVGILWSVGGLHDRAFVERLVIGKIRPMTYNGAKSKFDINKYMEMYSF